MHKVKLVYILVTIISVLFIYSALAFDLPKIFRFNKEDALEYWQEKVFKNKVLYVIEPESEGGFLSAKSEQACSGLFYKIRFKPKQFPMISWQWKVKKFPKKSAHATTDSSKKGWIERDDYAARMYVIFPSLHFIKTRSIEYIWDEELAVGTMMTSPYFRNIKLIVVESGRKNAGKWVFEEQNIYEDYKAAFGKPPSGSVGAIAIMTDTDNTMSTAEALYRNIKVGYKDEK